VTDLEGLIADAGARRISRREFIGRALALGLSATAIGSTLSACGGETADTVAPTATLDESKPEELILFNWADYIPESVCDTFTERTGIPVKVANYDNSEALLAKLRAGGRGYDVAVPGDYMVSILAKSGLLEPLRMDLIPNFAKVAPGMQKPLYDSEEDGNKYSVPYQWGTTGVAVRTDVITSDVTSWSSLWDPANKNEIQMLADERETLGAALKYLGYSLNTTDQGELDEAKATLIEQKPLVSAYSSTNVARPVINGVGLVHIYDGDARRAMGEVGVDKVKFVLPAEGFSMWSDNLVIPVGGNSVFWAHKLIDMLCEPAIAAEVSNYTQYLSPIPDATPMLDELLQASTPGPDVLAAGEGILDLGEFNRNYADAWQAVVAA